MDVSWTIKKAEHRRTDAFELQFWKRSETPLDCKEISTGSARRSNQSSQSLEELMLKLKLQYFHHLMQRADSFEKTLMLGKTEGRRRRGRQSMRRLDGITDSMDIGLGGRWELVAAVHGVTELDSI